MSEIRIRDAEEKDLQKIEDLILELIDSMSDREGLDLDKVIDNCRNLFRKEHSYLLVAEYNNEVIGLINFTTRQTLLHSGPSGLIDEFVVARKFRGKGVGIKLMHEAIARCKRLGCCEVEVSTEMTNTQAIEFYKSYGFEKKGVILEKDLI